MNQIPDWFQLENYIQPMTPYQWATHIAWRASLVRNDKFNTSEESKRIFFSLVENHPSIGNNRSINLRQSNFLKQQNMNKEPRALTQHSPNEILEAYANKATGKEVYFLGSFDHNDLTMVDEWLRINFDFSDQEIIETFTNYVRRRRKEAQINTLSHPILSYLHEWHVFRIIALFDLLYWREITGGALTHSKIGAAIWPDEELEREQRIRKKGKGLIFKVFRNSTVLQLVRELPKPDPKSEWLEGCRAAKELLNK